MTFLIFYIYLTHKVTKKKQNGKERVAFSYRLWRKA